MQSKGNQPNAEQKRWREDVRAVGCIGCGSQHGTEIHHVVGCSAKFNKQPVGHWWILPLCHECHELMGCPDDFARTKFGFSFVGRWDCERILFADLLTHFPDGRVPHETLSAVWEHRR